MQSVHLKRIPLQEVDLTVHAFRCAGCGGVLTFSLSCQRIHKFNLRQRGGLFPVGVLHPPFPLLMDVITLSLSSSSNQSSLFTRNPGRTVEWRVKTSLRQSETVQVFNLLNTVLFRSTCITRCQCLPAIVKWMSAIVFSRVLLATNKSEAPILHPTTTPTPPQPA